jgi:membrane-bound serine protease (ClpP class)
MKLILLALLSLSSLAFAQEADETQAKANPKPYKVVVIPIRDQIAPPELYILRRGLKTAIEQGAHLVILDMHTPGGRVDITFDMVKVIQKFPGKVYTYVNDEATSAGALISAGTDRIYMAPSATIGSSAPVGAGGADIDKVMKLKIVSHLRAKVRSISEGKGYRGDVVSAMIDENFELKIGDEIIKPKGELLNLTATESIKEYGDPPQPLLADGIEPSLKSLTDNLYGKGNYTITKLEVTWSEKLAQFITSIAPLLLAAGLLLIFIEFKTPGFGVFGIGGGILIAIFFFGHYAAGLSGHEAALFFLIGLTLVVIDLFFLPGFFILAVPGALLMLGSLLWGMSDIWPDQPLDWDSDFLFRPIVNLMIGVLGAVFFFILLLRYMPQGGLWGGMVLQSAVGGDTTRSSEARLEPSLIGATGYSVTALFPSGEIEINGKRYDARITLGTVPPGTPVKIISVGEFELKVEEIS